MLGACTCKYIPRFLTDRWDMTLPSTEKLIALPCACNLKVESMIKLATIFRAKKQLQLSLSMWWYNPPITGQSVTGREKNYIQDPADFTRGLHTLLVYLASFLPSLFLFLCKTKMMFKLQILSTSHKTICRYIHVCLS